MPVAFWTCRGKASTDGAAAGHRYLNDATLTEKIIKLHRAHGKRIGVRRVRDELARAGVRCSHKRVHWYEVV